MGKRSNFERRERDFYPTPFEAVKPLLDFLKEDGLSFDEPCAGDGALVNHLRSAGHTCASMSDIEPQKIYIEKRNALNIKDCRGDFFVTNPPWDRKILHPLIENLSDIAPTFLLFDADWMHTKQSIPFMNRIHCIISVGRIKWIPDSKMTGKDNCCWYLFDKPSQYGGRPTFIGRN